MVLDRFGFMQQVFYLLFMWLWNNYLVCQYMKVLKLSNWALDLCSFSFLMIKMIVSVIWMNTNFPHWLHPRNLFRFLGWLNESTFCWWDAAGLLIDGAFRVLSLPLWVPFTFTNPSGRSGNKQHVISHCCFPPKYQAKNMYFKLHVCSF